VNWWKTIRLYSWKILILGSLSLTLLSSAPAQEKSPGEKAPSAATDKQAPVPALAPSPEKGALEAPTPQKAMPLPRVRQEETLQKKEVTGKVGGQEIRAKEGEENK
jgi:hypothetical protein